MRIIIEHKPVAQPRHRSMALMMRNKRTGKIEPGIRQYEAEKNHPIHAYKEAVIRAINSAWSGGIIDAPVEMSALFVFPRPQNIVWKTRPMPRRPMVKKPDVDNLLKAIMDAMTGVLVVDDSRIVKAVASKVIASGDENPGVILDVFLHRTAENEK